ncbi:MAG: chorismate-binding protein [Bacteroidales bacterium]|nr:chorismate-binding protein [Bacteroidales bacterium]
MFSLNTYKAIEWCVYRRVPFVAYIAPGEKKGRFFSAPSLLQKPLEQAPKEGFFMGKFNEKSPDYLWVPFELDGEQTWKQRFSLPDNSTMPDPAPLPDTKREDYIRDVSTLIKNLELDGRKTVISRVKTEYFVDRSINDLLENLFAASGGCFAYCCYHPAAGFWMGSSPEIVYYKDSKAHNFFTMALAGTVGKNDEWDEKNITEQEIVAGDILVRLQEMGLDPYVFDHEDRIFGSIKHKCSLLGAQPGQFTPFEIIDAITPTAALCGYPRDIALKDIASIEKHPRSYYGGVIGVITKKETIAYANIRCVNFHKSRFTFYAGGGIMPESVAENEWEETNKKISSLMAKMLTD